MDTSELEKLLTPEDLLRLEERSMPEIVNGRLVPRGCGWYADGIATKVVGLIGKHVVPNKLGVMNGARGSYQIFPGDANRVRVPSVSFTRRERLSPDGLFQGHARIAPDLVVLVIFPGDPAAETFARIDDYQSAGVPLVWVVDPGTESVHVYRLDGSVARLREGDMLTGGEVLPGFEFPVARVFA